ncbi:MAG TPA: hypothetical protein VGF60_17015 [Xanthobacteraceae bacterium]|jgi:hypothetical protein
MTDSSVASSGKGRRVYKFPHPIRIPFFALGLVREKLKEVGIWDDMPQPLHRKFKAAQASWGGMIFDRADMDSIPDHLWIRLAVAYNLKWSYTEEGGLGKTYERIWTS